MRGQGQLAGQPRRGHSLYSLRTVDEGRVHCPCGCVFERVGRGSQDEGTSCRTRRIQKVCLQCARSGSLEQTVQTTFLEGPSAKDCLGPHRRPLAGTWAWEEAAAATGTLLSPIEIGCADEVFWPSVWELMRALDRGACAGKKETGGRRPGQKSCRSCGR